MCVPTTPTVSSRSREPSASIWSSSARSSRSSQGWPITCDAAASKVLGPSRAAARIEGLEGLRQGRDAGGGRAHRTDAARGESAVRRQARTASRPGKAPSPAATRPRCRSPSSGYGRSATASSSRELLEGEELSVFTSPRTRGPRARSRRRARLQAGPETATLGPNTGGMARHSPVEGRIGLAELERLVEEIHRPVVAELARRAAPFVGLLCAGLMLTEDGAAGARVQLPLR